MVRDNDNKSLHNDNFSTQHKALCVTLDDVSNAIAAKKNDDPDITTEQWLDLSKNEIRHAIVEHGKDKYVLETLNLLFEAVALLEAQANHVTLDDANSVIELYIEDIKKGKRDVLTLDITAHFNVSRLSSEAREDFEHNTLARLKHVVESGEKPNIVFLEDLKKSVTYEYPDDHIFYKDYKSHHDPEIAKMTAYEFYMHQYKPLADQHLISKSQFIEDEPVLYEALAKHCTKHKIKRASILPPTANQIKAHQYENVLSADLLEEMMKIMSSRTRSEYNNS